jgi:LAO/AO transport system kinase
MDPASLARAVKAADVHAVSRLITLLENQDPAAQATLSLLESAPRHAIVIGITGYPGAGKSTLIDRLVSAYRRQGKRLGVLAVDTTSPLTGGAILGDRIRMQVHSADAGVFIRSMGTRGHHGGLARATGDAIAVLSAAGFDVILVETVGVGQDEGEISGVAQTVVMVVAPGLGDEVQAMKAGLLEVAHIVVVNKADREGADNTARQLEEWVACVVRTNALNGDGLEELMKAIEQHQSRRPTPPP